MEIPISFKYFKDIFREFMSKFSRNDSQSLRSGCPKKFKLLKYEHIIHHFKARDLEIPLI